MPELAGRQPGRLVVRHYGRYFGFSARYWSAGYDWNNERQPAVLSFVIWYPRGRKTLGYLYPCIRWPF